MTEFITLCVFIIIIISSSHALAIKLASIGAGFKESAIEVLGHVKITRRETTASFSF